MIGNSLDHGTFLNDITLNKPVTIGGKTFKVVGILVSSGGGFGGGGGDNSVYMPSDLTREVITTNVSRNAFTSIMVKVTDPNVANQVAADIVTKLMPSRHVNPRTRDFTVTEFASIQAQITSVFQTISLSLLRLRLSRSLWELWVLQTPCSCLSWNAHVRSVCSRLLALRMEKL